MSRAAANESDLHHRLASVAGAALGEPVVVDDMDRLPGGASRETWRVVVRTPAGNQRVLVLRRDPPGAPPSGLMLEARLLEAASRAGVPVPVLVASGERLEGDGDGFLLMDFVAGETIPRRILRDDAYATVRPVLARQCGTILAALHRIPPVEVPGLPGGDALEQLRSLADRLSQPHPAFELAFRWLAEHKPAPTAETVVHGDFRNGNLIIGADGIRAVLDWELAHRGDPLEDLGWLCVKAWRFGEVLPVGGFGTTEDLVAAYENAGGMPVDATALHWWMVLGTLRWGIICIVQTLTHVMGMVRSVELAAIGRRVCEVEWDLLELLP
jgi:aminoglycoside phosphotransferase (APT) family kinase protein